MARFIVKIGMYAAVLVTTVLLTRFVLETWRHAPTAIIARAGLSIYGRANRSGRDVQL